MDIYTSRPFQRYKEYFKARCFDPCHRTLSFLKSWRTPKSHFRECEWRPHTSLKWGCNRRGEKSGFEKENKFHHKKAHHEGEWNRRQDAPKGERPKHFQGSRFKPKGNFVKKGAPFKGSQLKGDVEGKPKGACFNCNEVGHYSKDCPKPKLGIRGSKVNALVANLAQGECNHFIFLKGKVSKREVLCLLDIRASHNFITREGAERMELPLEELKAPIEVHFADGVPHPTIMQAKDVPLQLGNWRGKVDLLVSTLGGMDCILGMEFITQNNVLIEGHNKLIRIPSKNGIMRMKAYEVPSVGGSTIHLMLGKNFSKRMHWRLWHVVCDVGVG